MSAAKLLSQGICATADWTEERAVRWAGEPALFLFAGGGFISSAGAETLEMEWVVIALTAQCADPSQPHWTLTVSAP